MRFLYEGFRGLHSLFFPARCPYCSLEGVQGCKTCLDQWRKGISVRYVERVPILSMHPYDHEARAILLAAKERGERDARTFISVALQFGVEEIVKRSDPHRQLIIATIPATKRAMRNRGEDFLGEILNEFHPKNEARIRALPLLRWRHEVRDQSSLTLHERSINLRDSLVVDEEVVMRRGFRSSGVGVIVIDDVLTTGATMRAAISAISHSSLGASSLMAGVTACYSVNPRFA